MDKGSIAQNVIGKKGEILLCGGRTAAQLRETLVKSCAAVPGAGLCLAPQARTWYNNVAEAGVCAPAPHSTSGWGGRTCRAEAVSAEAGKHR